MPPPDPLDRLLASWKPEAPDAGARLVADTLRALRAGPPSPAWRRGLEWLDEVAQEWLPSPGALLPAMGAVVLLLGAAHLTSARNRAAEASAAEWRDSVMRPASPLWISTAYRDIARPPAPDRP